MAILQLIEPLVKDLGGFIARRSLPYPHRQMVGPFIFFDHVGPSVLPPNKGNEPVLQGSRRLPQTHLPTTIIILIKFPT